MSPLSELCQDCGGFGVNPSRYPEEDICANCAGTGAEPAGPISEQIVCEHAFHCNNVDCVGQTGRRADPDEAKFGPNLCGLIGGVVQAVEDIAPNPTFARKI
jgi:hypothetical protein